MKEHVMASIQPCPEWRRALNAFHSDDLSSEEREQFNKHLETCANCRAVKAEYAAINTLILDLPRARPLPALPAQNLIDPSPEISQLDEEAPVNVSLPGLSSAGPAHFRAARRHENRLTSKLNLVASMAVIGILLSGLLLLLSTLQPGTANVPASARLYLLTLAANEQRPLTLFALNPGTGQVYWKRQLASIVNGYGFSTQGNIYLPAQDGNVYAFRGSDGEALWHTSISHGAGETPNGLFAYQNLIIDSVNSTSGKHGDLYALDARTGNIVWHTSASCDAASSNDCRPGSQFMLVANGLLYGLAEDGLSAWNAGNGHFLWRNGQFQPNSLYQSMVVSQGKIYIANVYQPAENAFQQNGSSFATELAVMDARSGRFLHQLNLPSPETDGIVLDIATNAGAIYVLGDRGIFAYRASDDSLLWKQASSYHAQGLIYAGSSAIYVNYADFYLGKIQPGTRPPSDNNLYALSSSDGHQIWARSIGDGGNVFPVDFNAVVCLDNVKSIDGLRASSGKQLWQFSTGGGLAGLFGG